MKRRSMTSTSYIARTGILLALAVIFQVGFRSFAQPLVGPLVNMTLIISVLSVGVASGLTIGCFTPLIAFFMGIMPLFPLVPIIMAGNAIFVSAFAFIRDRTSDSGEYLALVAAALLKFAFLAISVRKLLVIFIPKVPQSIVAAFSIPQLYTALAGGIIAIVLHKIIKNNY
ncbi:ECF transporter S component [Peptoclostridium litorale]|nr:ECF transporter S component [Peptoclostridium litorale]